MVARRIGQEVSVSAPVASDVLSLNMPLGLRFPKSSTGCGWLALVASRDLKWALGSFWKGTCSSRLRS